MKGFDLYRKRTHFSVNSLVGFARCPRKFFYHSGLRLDVPEEPFALTFGSAIHSALPHAFFGDLDKAISSFDLVWGGQAGDEKRNPTNGRMIIADYWESHRDGRSIYNIIPPPAGVLKIEDKVSEYEVPFALDIGLDVPLVGRIDSTALHRDTHEPWGIEWKTTSEMSTRFFEGFTFHPQVCAYTLALRAYGIDCKGVIVEGLKVSSAKKDPHGTLSTPVYCSNHQISDFLVWARWIGSQILACEAQGEFPKDPSACTPYPQFGMPGYQCNYMPLCLTADWTSMKDMFVQKDDRPFQMTPTTPATVVNLSVEGKLL